MMISRSADGFCGTIATSMICFDRYVKTASIMATTAMVIRNPTTHFQCGRTSPRIRRSVPPLNLVLNSSSSNS